VPDGNLAIVGRESGAEGRGSIALNQDDVGLEAEARVFHRINYAPGEHAQGLIWTHDVQVEVWLDFEVLQHLIEHRAMLTRMHYGCFESADRLRKSWITRASLMASGRVPRTAMILQGFANSVHSTGRGELDEQKPTFSTAACREAHAQAWQRACSHYRPSAAYAFDHFCPLRTVCYWSINRELGVALPRISRAHPTLEDLAFSGLAVVCRSRRSKVSLRAAMAPYKRS
jgi:hypothetical protein